MFENSQYKTTKLGDTKKPSAKRGLRLNIYLVPVIQNPQNLQGRLPKLITKIGSRKHRMHQTLP